ncbi:MAG: ABC transporter permease [Clostridia bacterium]|nr:ABC transporter permease [Clostridia bacterium]
MRYNVVSYLIGEGFRNIFKNKKSTVSALTTMCLCMLIFGLFFIVGENINHIMNTIEDAQGMTVFFKSSVEEEKVTEYGVKIRELQGVNKAQYVSREENLINLKEGFKNDPSVYEGLEFEQLGPSYKVTLSDLSRNQAIQNEITSMVGKDLDEIRSSNEEIALLMSIAKGVRIFTLALLIVLVIISLVIIGNTIKLTVHARRKEISIMKYVGATNGFIRWPFIVEGAFIGIAAALITILIVGLAYNALIPNLAETMVVKKLDITFVTFNEMFNMIIIVYLLLGIGIGTTGSIMSMRKYLEV